jgi:hypothetical protein
MTVEMSRGSRALGGQMIGHRNLSLSSRPLGRRAVLQSAAAGAALTLTPWRALAQTVPPDGRLLFNLIRHGSTIGQETVTFQPDGPKLTVTVDVSIRVTLAMIPVFRLHHHETETWQDGRLLSFAATTVKNGSKFYAQGWQNGHTFMARGSSRPNAYVAPPDALPTSQWNHAMLTGPMISTENGKLMDPTVTDRGLTEVALADGTRVQARHFNARGDLRFDTFFSDSWEWVGLSFPAPDGSVVTYQKV